MIKHRLAIISTHPIQYYAPMFKLLNNAANITLCVFYTLGNSGEEKYDEGFNKIIKRDNEFLSGYTFEWVVNTAKSPTSANFNGVKNPGLIDQIEQWKPDALLVFGWAYQGHLRSLLHFKNKVPVFFRGDSTLIDEGQGFRTIVKSIFKKWVYKHIDYALYTGSQNKAYFLKSGLKEFQLIFAPHAIDNSRFAAPQREKVLSIRHRLRIAPDDLLILFAGKFEAKKDPLSLLRAFRKIARQDVKLLFVGNGNLETHLKAEAKNDKRIHFLDFQNQTEMPAIYQTCDIFCLPSKGPGETWGLAVNEAMACGKTILLSDKVGCGIDMVTPGRNGEIFEAGNILDLAGKLNKLIGKGKTGLKQTGERSEQIVQDWNFTEQINAIIKLLNAK